VTAPVGRRRGAFVLLVVLVVFVALWWVVAQPSSPVPYSPSSTDPNGAKALALLLGQLGEKVTTAGPLPAPGRDVAVLLNDQLDDATRSQVSSWVRRGGTLVVADPSSPLFGASVAQGAPDQAEPAAPLLAPDCDLPWAKGVGEIAAEGGTVLEVPSDGSACFAQGGDAFAVATPLGAGVVVALGGAGLWSNADLARQDNALLAANLLAPGPGYTVTWLTTPWVVGGNQDIWSLVPPRVKLFLAGLGSAVLVACLWRARRLGRPVLEEPVVPIPGSELVVATGRLLARNRRCQEAASLLRAELSAGLRSRFGQAQGTPAATVASVVALHTDVDRDAVVAALDGPLPRDEEELLALTRSLQRIREEVLAGTATRH
jgi:hypothetical protein